MRKIQSIAVYCASSSQLDSAYYEEARRLGQLLAEAGMSVVYGDGGLGLMGALADGVLKAGGHITGVIPQFMVDEGWNNPRSSKSIIVDTMHERKAKIEQLSDAMVALPGGVGTYEELLECLTWKQLGLHDKPIVILNTNGYYDGLIACLKRMVDQRFMRPVHLEMFRVVNKAEEVLPVLLEMPDWDRSTRRDAAI